MKVHRHAIPLRASSAPLHPAPTHVGGCRRCSLLAGRRSSLEAIRGRCTVDTFLEGFRRAGRRVRVRGAGCRELLCEGTKEIHNLQPPLCRRSPAIDSTLARKVGSSCHQGFRCCAAALSLTLAIVPAAQAQTATTFEEAISPQYSYAEAVRQTSDGGYVVGATFSIPPYAALVAKLDWSGNLQSQKQYQSSIGSSGRT